MESSRFLCGLGPRRAWGGGDEISRAGAGPEATNVLTRHELAAAGDEALVRAAQADPRGEAGRLAASALFERYQDRLYAWCFRHVREREGALQLAQETLVAAFQALPRFEGRAQFSTWLFAIARYKYLGSLRSRRLPIDDVELDEIPSAAGGVEEAFVRREEEERVLAAIHEALEPPEQTALWLRCVECKPVEEITRLMRLTTRSGARGLLQSARRKLREHLEAAVARRPSS